MNDDQFTKLSQQVTDLGDQMLKLYQHMEQRFGVIEAKLDDKASKSQAEQVLNALDTVAKQQETDEHERLAANHQLDRHEAWLHQLAKKTDTKLSYE